jgi:hypothetical protein
MGPHSTAAFGRPQFVRGDTGVLAGHTRPHGGQWYFFGAPARAFLATGVKPDLTHDFRDLPECLFSVGRRNCDYYVRRSSSSSQIWCTKGSFVGKKRGDEIFAYELPDDSLGMIKSCFFHFRNQPVTVSRGPHHGMKLWDRRRGAVQWTDLGTGYWGSQSPREHGNKLFGRHGMNDHGRVEIGFGGAHFDRRGKAHPSCGRSQYRVVAFRYPTYPIPYRQWTGAPFRGGQSTWYRPRAIVAHPPIRRRYNHHQ